MEELSHAARILKLRDMLDRNEFVTIGQLRQKFGVTRKTVYNDLAALEEAGVHLQSAKGPSGEARWMLKSKAKKWTVTLGAGQVVSFGLAQLALSFLDGTEVHDQLGQVMERLTEGASPATRKQLDALGRKVGIVPHGPKLYRRKAVVIDGILDGLLRDQLVEIRYRSPGKKKATKHVIEPLSLLLYREALYLIANSRTFDGLRISFAVDRITRSKWLKGQGFPYPQDYSPTDQFDGAFGLVGGEREKVEIIFDPEQAKYVRERRWHPTQRFKKLPDGRVRMTMTVSGVHDLLLWLVGHTGTFEVVSPPSLKEEVRKRLKDGIRVHPLAEPEHIGVASGKAATGWKRTDGREEVVCDACLQLVPARHVERQTIGRGERRRTCNICAECQDEAVISRHERLADPVRQLISDASADGLHALALLALEHLDSLGEQLTLERLGDKAARLHAATEQALAAYRARRGPGAKETTLGSLLQELEDELR